MANMQVTIGDQRLVVNPDNITLRKVKELADALVELKRKHSLLTKFPLNDKESLEEWSERIAPLLVEENKRKKNEKSDEYINRLYKTDLDKQELVLDTLKLIAKSFDNQESKITPENSDQISYVSAKRFIKDLFTLCDLDASAFE